MAIFARKVNGKQRAWLKKYEDETGFEPLYQEELDAGTMDRPKVLLKLGIRYDSIGTDK